MSTDENKIIMVDELPGKEPVMLVTEPGPRIDPKLAREMREFFQNNPAETREHDEPEFREPPAPL